MAEYGDGRSTSSKDALSVVAASTIFRYICFCIYRLKKANPTRAKSTGKEMKDAKLRPVENGQALVQQKLPDGSEKRKGTGS